MYNEYTLKNSLEASEYDYSEVNKHLLTTLSEFASKLIDLESRLMQLESQLTIDEPAYKILNNMANALREYEIQ